jgi:hypothetical protein
MTSHKGHLPRLGPTASRAEASWACQAGRLLVLNVGRLTVPICASNLRI